MGFSALERARYPVSIVTEYYYYTGKVEPFGPILIWLNDPERHAFPLYEVAATALDGGSTVDSFTRDEIFLLKQDVVALDVLSSEARQQVQLIQRTQKLVVYTPRFVVNAAFPAAADTRLGDIFDGLKGSFLVMTGAQIYPMRPSRAQVFRTSEMVILNSHYITAYHAA